MLTLPSDSLPNLKFTVCLTEQYSSNLKADTSENLSSTIQMANVDHCFATETSIREVRHS